MAEANENGPIFKLFEAVQLQQRDGNTTDRRERLDDRLIKAKMIGPLLLTGIKERDK